MRAGELRAVRATEKRIAAAANLGFERILAPPGSKASAPRGLAKNVVEVRNVQALKSRLVSKGAKQPEA